MGIDVSGTAGAAGVLDESWVARWSRTSGATVPHADISPLLQDAFAGIEEIGRALGLDTSRLAGARVPFNFQVGSYNGIGVRPEDALAAFRESIGQVTDALALQLKPNLMEFAQAGETATQTLMRLVEVQDQLTRQQEGIEAQLRGGVRALPGQLGITALEEFRGALATSGYVAPLERVTAARSIYEAMLARARSGDLDAVQGFPQAAQQLLGTGREAYASGPQFAELFTEVNRSLNDVLSRQQTIQTEILADVPVAIERAAQDQVAELKRGFKTVTDALSAVQEELRQIRAAA